MHEYLLSYILKTPAARYEIIMSTEPPKSQKLIRFRGAEVEGRRQAQSLSKLEDEEIVDKRRTRFPSGLNPDFTLLTAAKLEKPVPERRSPTRAPPRLPLVPNIDNATPRRSIAPVTIHQVELSSLPMIRHEDPWLNYTCLRRMKRGSRVQVACTKSIPTTMVTVKETRKLLELDKVIKFRHSSLVVFVGCYEYEGKTMLVSEYAQVSLRQTIAIPYDFEQSHVSEVCSQVY